jgi:hypothetical protein
MHYREVGAVWSKYEHLMNDAKILMNSFHLCSVGHVKMNANKLKRHVG